MRVAFILHVATTGGITRFARALIDGMRIADPSVEIGLFVDSELAVAEGFRGFYEGTGVEVIPICDPTVTVSARSRPNEPEKSEEDKARTWRLGRDLLLRWPSLHRLVRSVYSATRSHLRGDKDWTKFTLPAEVRGLLANYDVIYLALPAWIEPFDPPRPVVGTFHDLNYRHFPGSFTRSLVKIWQRDFSFWSKTAHTTITSTKFIAGDLAEAFPWVQGKTEVIYLAPYGHIEVTPERRASVLVEFGLADRPYIIYPANITPHKNLVALVEAVALAKGCMGEAAPVLVITGAGTDLINADGGSEYVRSIRMAALNGGLELGRDVLALGYVDDDQVDALTLSASLVVSTSLYEAGCGPAMDAWQSGVPVAFSNIPPFMEQLEVLGVEALVFDPRSPHDIARVICSAFGAPAELEGMVERSRVALARQTWVKVGQDYLRVLAEAMTDGR